MRGDSWNRLCTAAAALPIKAVVSAKTYQELCEKADRDYNMRHKEQDDDQAGNQ